MSILLIDSFDDGLTGQKWTSTSEIDFNVNSRTGAFAAGIGDASNDGGNLVRAFPVAQQHATMIAGFGFNAFVNSNGQPIIFFQGDSGTITHVSMYRNSDGSLSVYRGAGSTLLQTSAPNIILQSNWYYIEIKVTLADAGGTVEVRVNNTTIISFTGDTKNGGVATVFNQIVIGGSIGGDNPNYRVDDVYLANGAGSINNDFLGDSRVHALMPDANGNYSQLVGQDGDSVNNYLNVDENPPDSGTTYNGSGTDGNKDSYNFPSLPLAVTAIRAVSQRAWAASSDAGSRAARQFVRIAGTDYPGADFNVGATYLHFETLHETSPATAVPFTISEFNGAEWGFEVRA